MVMHLLRVYASSLETRSLFALYVLPLNPHISNEHDVRSNARTADLSSRGTSERRPL